MKHVAMLSMALMLYSGAAFSQEQRALAFFGDEFRTQCQITNTSPGSVTIHMYLTGAGNDANTVSFYAPTPACWPGAAWLGDDVNPSYLFLGSTHHDEYGITITFVGCRELPVYLGSMLFWATGSDPCCHYDVLPGQAATVNQLRIIDCDGKPEEIPYTSVTINPNDSCPCAGYSPVAVEETTWGQVKALYR